VTPTARTLELASQIEVLLAEARGVLATAAPFDPATSQREFTIGAPDGVANLYLLPLFAKLRRDAPGINIRMRQVLPAAGRATEQAWDGAFTDLDTRALDLAIGPFAAVPNRFEVAELGIESFVIISRSGHPFAKRPSLDAYCKADHLIVSQSGDARGFVDMALAELGRTRRAALTVPAFAMALSIVAETDLLSAVPRSFAKTSGPAAGVVLVEPPLSLPQFKMRSVVPKAGLTDSGLAWLRSELTATHSKQFRYPRRRPAGRPPLGGRSQVWAQRLFGFSEPGRLNRLSSLSQRHSESMCQAARAREA
jgi:DNA-binding transcriptional LysR family regulator